MRKRSWVIRVAMLAGLMALGFSFSFNDYVYREMLKGYYDASPSLPNMLLWDLVYWPTWAALTPLIFWIARRAPLGRNSWHPNLLINLVAVLLLPVLQRAIYLVIAWPFQKAVGGTFSFFDLLLYNLPLGFIVCVIIFLISHLIAELVKEELQMSRLKTELTQAQLQALKMQLQPHFLFNALNSISALLHEDVNAADEKLARLGDFLRLTLRNSGAQIVTLKEELEFVRGYLEIEKVRLEERLQVSYELEPQTLAAQVPNLILQPSVENAIKHGVRQSLGQVQIVVSARREDGRLYLQIKDNGERWQGNDDDCKEGFGTTNTRARLESIYGSEHRFDLARTPDGWTMATLEMPFSTAENA